MVLREGQRSEHNSNKPETHKFGKDGKRKWREIDHGVEGHDLVTLNEEAQLYGESSGDRVYNGRDRHSQRVTPVSDTVNMPSYDLVNPVREAMESDFDLSTHKRMRWNFNRSLRNTHPNNERDSTTSKAKSLFNISESSNAKHDYQKTHDNKLTGTPMVSSRLVFHPNKPSQSLLNFKVVKNDTPAEEIPDKLPLQDVKNTQRSAPSGPETSVSLAGRRMALLNNLSKKKHRTKGITSGGPAASRPKSQRTISVRIKHRRDSEVLEKCAPVRELGRGLTLSNSKLVNRSPTVPTLEQSVWNQPNPVQDGDGGGEFSNSNSSTGRSMDQHIRKKSARSSASSSTFSNDKNIPDTFATRNTVKTGVEHEIDMEPSSIFFVFSSDDSNDEREDNSKIERARSLPTEHATGVRRTTIEQVSSEEALVDSNSSTETSDCSDWNRKYTLIRGRRKRAILRRHAKQRFQKPFYHCRGANNADSPPTRANSPSSELPCPRRNGTFSTKHMTLEQAEKAADHAINTNPLTARDQWYTPKYAFQSSDEEARPRKVLLRQSMIMTPKIRAKSKPAANQTVGLRKLGEFDAEDQAAVAEFERYYCAIHGLSQAQWVAKIHRRATDKEGRAFWREFADNIPGRSTAAISKFCKRTRLPASIITTPMTKEDDEELLQLVEQHGPAWLTIGQEMNRPAERVRDHYRNVLKDEATRIQVWWTPQEDEELRSAVGKIAATALEKCPDTEDVSTLFNFVAVSEEMMRKRTRYQCYTRWNSLLRKGKTSLAEEIKLAVDRLGLDLDSSLIDRVAPDKYAGHSQDV